MSGREVGDAAHEDIYSVCDTDIQVENLKFLSVGQAKPKLFKILASYETLDIEQTPFVALTFFSVVLESPMIENRIIFSMFVSLVGGPSTSRMDQNYQNLPLPMGMT